jgi:hypothetical protein
MIRAKLLLTGIAALSVLSASAAHTREWQGNMPKPVGKLPPYPPVVCVAPNWKPEPCESRQSSPVDAWEDVGKALGEFFKWLEWTKTNWLGTVLMDYRPWDGVWPGHVTVLYYEKGGLWQDHVERWRALAASGDNVEIRGRCISACTTIMAHVPNERICFDKQGTLEFHMGRDPKTKEPMSEWTEVMFNRFPKDIRMWLRNKGWIEKATLDNFWVLTAEELWAMGYRKCKEERQLGVMRRLVPYPDGTYKEVVSWE